MNEVRHFWLGISCLIFKVSKTFRYVDTDNELEKQVGGYEHIVVRCPIKIVDENIVETVQKLPRGTIPGDFLDAIVVGMDMLIKKFGSSNKGKTHLCLITDAQYPIKEPYEGTKEDQVDIISQQMKAHGMKLDCIITIGKLSKAINQKILAENDHLLSQFSRKGVAKMRHVGTPTSLLGALRTRTISSVAIFKDEKVVQGSSEERLL
ncbi:hypothetical protein Taro_022838 [Colocasia esculenta]|uniref:Uncharacterized protein n=1 Tax=Colocasia esculenta TaxID=4460 RepID=A0A843V9K6_COLES|nr:hypothetical protein [Colocasia esculenta]